VTNEEKEDDDNNDGIHIREVKRWMYPWVGLLSLDT